MATGENQSPTRDLVEFCVAYGLILATIWTLNPWQRWFYWIAIAWVVVTTCLHRPTWKALGLGLAGLRRSLWVVVVAALLAGVAVCTAYRMHSLHPLHGPTPLLSHIWGYLIWSVMQQFLAADLLPASPACDYCRVRWPQSLLPRAYSPWPTCPIRC